MVPQTETQWILLGLGTMVFISAALRVLSGEARRMLEFHFVMRKAMLMRNRYAEQLLSLQPPKVASSKTSPAASPPPAATAVPVASDAAAPVPAAALTETDFGATALMPDENPPVATGQAA